MLFSSSAGISLVQYELVKEALKQGLLINVTSDKVIRLLPPLVMQRNEAEQVVNAVSALVKEFLKT